MPIEIDEFGLKPKEREFADLYRGGDDEVRGNAKRCYMRLHPKSGDGSAEVSAHKWLRKPKIEDYLRLKLEEVSEECNINAAWLLKRLADEATADVADLYMESGELKPVHEWPEIWRQGLVAGLDVQQERGEGGEIGIITKIKLSDRIKRLELIGKHVGVQAFNEKLDITSGGKRIETVVNFLPVNNETK